MPHSHCSRRVRSPISSPWKLTTINSSTAFRLRRQLLWSEHPCSWRVLSKLSHWQQLWAYTSGFKGEKLTRLLPAQLNALRSGFLFHLCAQKEVTPPKSDVSLTYPVAPLQPSSSPLGPGDPPVGLQCPHFPVLGFSLVVPGHHPHFRKALPVGKDSRVSSLAFHFPKCVLLPFCPAPPSNYLKLFGICYIKFCKSRFLCWKDLSWLQCAVTISKLLWHDLVLFSNPNSFKHRPLFKIKYAIGLVFLEIPPNPITVPTERSTFIFLFPLNVLLWTCL